MLLRRQLRKLGLTPDTPPTLEQWREHLSAVQRAYDQADQDRYTMERSLMISSREMGELYEGLKRSADNFTTLVERSPDLVFVAAADMTVLYVNPAMIAALGYLAPDALVGKTPIGTFVHPDDAPTLLAYRARRDQGAEVGAIQLRWVRRDGVARNIEAVSSPITYDGAPALLVMGRDVTEKLARDQEERHISELLQASEERYRQLFEQSPQPIVMFDVESLAIVAANDAAVRAYGYCRDEFLGLRVTDLKVEEDMPELLRGMSGADTNGAPGSTRPAWSGQRRHRRKDGTLIDVDVTAHALSMGGRRVMLATFVDVTEKRRLEAQLRQAQKMDAVGQLAGGIAHDFNNLLGVIMADMDFIKEGLEEGHPLLEGVADVQRATERAAGLTRQLLAFSRQQVLQPRVLALNALVSDLEKMLRRIIGEDIQLEVRLEPRLGAVKADPGQIEQVIMNLVVNARDAMPGGGRLTIATCNAEIDEEESKRLGEPPVGPYVAVRVADEGCGMDEATLARAFEPFFTTKGVGQGTGLGLATVFGIVKQSRGAIDVASAPGKGATFTVYLPRVDARPSRRAEARPVTVAHGHERLLLVEDDGDLRRVTSRILTSRGYQVVVAESAENALAILEAASRVDLMVTDLVMPGLDGYELATMARERDPGLKILLISGYTDHRVLRRGDGDRTWCFLPKPFGAEELARAVRSALDAHD